MSVYLNSCKCKYEFEIIKLKITNSGTYPRNNLAETQAVDKMFLVIVI